MRYDFASDNTAGMAPSALNALIEANSGFAAGYGADQHTAAAADAVRALLGVDADVRFVFSGTAANSIALSMLAQPFEAVLAHHTAHVCTDETGAPGFFGHGVGLIGLPGYSGKIDVEGLCAALDEPVVGHRQPAAAITLTQATEYGTVYSEEELSLLIRMAKGAGLGVHVDGARLANAVAAGFDPKSLGRMGVDIVSLGGAKAGAHGVEALVIINRSLSRRIDNRLKQGGQTASKGRLLAAPLGGLITSGEWLSGARHANAMAQRLADGIEGSTPFVLAHPVESNTVFVRMPDEALQAVRDKGFAVYAFDDGSVRFVCSWATKAEAVDELIGVLSHLN
ncbi:MULTISPECIES: threonine aldolase family protein [unclassified Brevundimonas]|uniref:threonine aldolase family protein n=1 Tax=unclassified Brevundimonas TaxID=2622653 RepID=UPI00289C399D|nr:beta-eliminating lyase-related protein [Brevundimonas sp.]